ncbi:MAG: two-component system sensor histidine kinase KdbD [Candidatus Melainabacteria bacterium]|nr:MAG: two-component system sensor histidine kinase KdbD [Candidatus Melainabacteria bacterium]
MTDAKRDPDLLLSRLKQEESKNKRGRLKIFFGAVAGVGKTYSMLYSARKLQEQNIDVVIGYVETHGRQETAALMDGLEILPEKLVEYKGRELKEFDIDAALKRKPAVILVDELAHTNAPDSRHIKRWQDVQELLEAGIDVLTTLNVQHVESLHDVVAQITTVSVRERVPDSLLERADEIELVDLPPEELLERLREGRVYIAEQAKAAMANFFRKGNLIALRELALRYTAERVVAAMDEYRQAHDILHPWPAVERILVCISPSPLASRLVRAGKRMAEALRAKWTVLFVQGSRESAYSKNEKVSLTQTLRLAEQLGAETLELSGNNVPEEIIKCAQQSNVSKIIIGKPARHRWAEILFGSVVDSVIRLSGPIDVYVITGDENTSLPSRVREFNTTSAYSAYLRTIVVVAVCTCVAKLMLPYFEPSNIVMAYLLGVVIVATRYGRGPSILASVLSVAAFDFFCVPPYLNFAVSDTQYIITFLVMLLVALVISTLTVTIKQQAEEARLRELRTAALYSMSRDLSSTLDMKSLLEIGLRHIGDVFDSRTALYLVGTDGALAVASQGEGKRELHDPDIGIAAWVHQNKQLAGLNTDTLPGASALYLPLQGAQKNVGVLVVKPVQEDRFMSPEQVRLLETFANQLASACERALLSEDSAQAHLQVKTEQLRSSLLSSISHDLRTPLATIAGAASSIIEGTEALNLERCKEMVKEIYHESMRLNRLVSNLLDMTKLQSGTLQVVQELHPVDEVIGAALSSMEERLTSHVVKTQVPADPPCIIGDATLLQQVLLNLIENAIKYSPMGSEIDITAEWQNGMVLVTVGDRGPGIRNEHKAKIFEKFYREDTKTASGAGLGLAICNGIIEAHGGHIWVEDRPGGGANFKFTVPASETPNTRELEDPDPLERKNEV